MFWGQGVDGGGGVTVKQYVSRVLIICPPLEVKNVFWRSERSHNQVIKIKICDGYNNGTCDSTLRR